VRSVASGPASATIAARGCTSHRTNPFPRERGRARAPPGPESPARGAAPDHRHEVQRDARSFAEDVLACPRCGGRMRVGLPARGGDEPGGDPTSPGAPRLAAPGTSAGAGASAGRRPGVLVAAGREWALNASRRGRCWDRCARRASIRARSGPGGLQAPGRRAVAGRQRPGMGRPVTPGGLVLLSDGRAEAVRATHPLRSPARRLESSRTRPR
jgi:hypothetical protein